MLVSADYQDAIRTSDAQFVKNCMQDFEEANRALLARISAIDTEVLGEWEARFMLKAQAVIKQRMIDVGIIAQKRADLDKKAGDSFEMLIQTNASRMLASARSQEKVAMADIDTIHEHGRRSVAQYREELREARDEKIASAIIKATDLAPFIEFMKRTVSAFAKNQQENAKKIRLAQKKADKVFCESIETSDKKILETIASTVRTQPMCYRLITERNAAREAVVHKRHNHMAEAFEIVFKTQLAENAELLDQLEALDISTIDAAVLDGKSLEQYCFE